MIYLIGIIIAFFLGLLLLGKKNKNLADKVLFAWFLIIGLHLSMFYLFTNKIIFNYPYLLGFHIIFPLLHGPFLYIYTGTLTNQLKLRKNILHFLPAFLSILYFFDYFLLDNASKIGVFYNNGEGFQNKLFWYSTIVKISGVIYVILSLFLLKKHQKNVVNQFSNTEKINLYWLQSLIVGVSIVWIFVFIGNVDYLYYSIVLFIILIGYFGINQVGIFNNSQIEVLDSDLEIEKIDENFIAIKEKTKYKKSGLDKEKAEKMYALLKVKMTEKQYYLNPDLTLVDLAQVLEIHPNHLSQIINTYEQMNFYDYINKMRIDKFISLIENPENKKFTILALAFDCGFNSKSTFNKQFKKVMNQTPTEYLQNI